MNGRAHFGLLFLCLSFLLVAQTALAQGLHSELVLQGLKHPIAFVQDPAHANVQFVVEQGGRIRPAVDGRLQDTDFLDLSGVISANREGGLLGMAFAPDYAVSGRFFVNFTNADDNTVIARFTTASDDALRANAQSRFDLVWPDGHPFIVQPYCCHYGGHLAFGPDGYLYIGLGDSSPWDDPDDNAQNPRLLLGKMLRLDVAVPETDERGYVVPRDNPFVGHDGVRPEIWAAGLRNPWRFNFDAPSLGGTGALIIADVGQDTWEEFDYEPAGRGGRNYGWRNREAAVEYVSATTPWFEPLTDPTFAYAHDGGRAIIGGYVYRGRALGPAFAGRYFFGDFMTGQLWSAALKIDPANGEAMVDHITEHSSEVGYMPLDYFAAFGQDASGELYVVSWWHGTVYRLVPNPLVPHVVLTVDIPVDRTTVPPAFTLAGWTLDSVAQGNTGIDAVHVWAFPTDGGSPIWVGLAQYGLDRPDVGAVFGKQFNQTGFRLDVTSLPSGRYVLAAYAHSSYNHSFTGQFVEITVSERWGSIRSGNVRLPD